MRIGLPGRMLIYIVGIGMIWGNNGIAQPARDAAPPPATPASPLAMDASPRFEPSAEAGPDWERRKTQWLALYGILAQMSSGQPLVGGGAKIARLRWAHLYITIANLKFAAEPKDGSSALMACLCVESGFKLAAGPKQRHVFYFGLEAGLGAAGYDRRLPDRTRYATAASVQLLSPHLEYNYHLADHVAITFELKMMPGILSGTSSADRNRPGLTVESPPSVFSSGLGMAF